MRFLIDNALSHIVSSGLAAAGFDSVHVRDYGMAAASDDEIFDRATAESRTIISADTDFGYIFATRKATNPSIILFRGEVTRRPTIQVNLLLANLSKLQADIEAGSVIAIEQTRMRIRRLPLS